MSNAVINLHIGVNKTGTSALQRFFHINRSRLLASGILYPTTGTRDARDYAHYPLSDILGFSHEKSSVDRAIRKQLKSQLDEEIQRSEAGSVVISSEFFIRPNDVKTVKEFFNNYDVRVVVYLRRHDTWWQSVYSQSVKTVQHPPWKRGFDGYLNHQKKTRPGYGRYRQLVDRWADEFGRENIIVRPYESQQNQPDIVADFLQAIGHDVLASGIKARSKLVNKSLSARAINLLDIYQRVDAPPDIRDQLVEYALTLSDSGNSPSIISPITRLRLITENSDDYEYIARVYMGREDGRLFLAPLPDPTESWTEPRSLSPMALVEETLRAMAPHSSGISDS